MHEQALDLVVECRAVGKVHKANCAASDLVLVGGPDTAPRRADAERRIGGFPNCVELAVQWKYQGSVLGNAQVVGRDIDALLLELGDLCEERVRVEDNAVADDGQFSLSDHTGRQ